MTKNWMTQNTNIKIADVITEKVGSSLLTDSDVDNMAMETVALATR